MNAVDEHSVAQGRSTLGSKLFEPATGPNAGADDCLTAAVLFAIIGGFAALWMFDLSLASGAIAAMFSAFAGALFANG